MNSIGHMDFRWLAKFSLRFHRWLLLFFFLLLGLSIFLVLRLKPQSDVAHLLPAHAPKTQAFVSFLKQFGASDSLFVALETKSGGEVESFKPFAEILADELGATGEFKEIRGRMNPSERKSLETLFVRKALLYLSEKDLREMERRLSNEAIFQRVREFKTKLASPLGSWILRGTVQDPLDLWPIFQKYLPATGIVSERGVFLSSDRKMILIVGKPRGTAPDISYDEKLMTKIQDAEAAAMKKFLQANKDPRRPDFNDLQIGLAGGYVSALEDAQMIKKELGRNFSFSLVAVLILFTLAFRRFLAFLYAFFPLLASPLLTLALFSPFLARLSESTAAFSAILVGLSIDFIILLYGRYLEERNAGMDLLGSLQRSLGHTGAAVWTGAATTAVAYFALVDSRQAQLAHRRTWRPAWFPIAGLPRLAFDNNGVIDYALQRLRAKLDYSNVAYSLLPPYFTLSQLQRVHEAILSRPLDKRNFRKRMLSLGIIEPTGRTATEGAHRPAQLYAFRERRPVIF